MNKKTISRRSATVMKCIAFFCLLLMAGACGKDDSLPEPEPTPTPTPTPTPDPDNGEVSFVIDNENGSGTGTTDSPAVVEKGETLSMAITQKSKYTDSDGTVFECEPKATIEVFAQLDTVYVDNKDKLTSVQEKPEVTSSQSGTNPIRNAINQKFLIGEQYVNFDLAYEIYNYVNKAEETIEMPYIKVNQANFGSSNANEETPETKARSETLQPVVTLKALPQTRATVSDTVLYEVNVRFNLDIESMNAKTENKQTLAFSVNYLGAVVTTTDVPDPEPELVKVEYRTDYIWEEAHDNLPLLYYAIVYRDRYYRHSDGREEILTDRFVDNGHTVESSAFIDPVDFFPGRPEWIEDEIIYDKYEQFVNDSIWSFYHSTFVPDLTKLRIGETFDDGFTGSAPGEWENYVISKLYSESLDLPDNPSSDSDNKWENASGQTGWYFIDTTHQLCYLIYYGDVWIARPTLKVRFYDQCLVIDGKRITFLDHLPEHTWNSYVEDVSGPGKKFVYECKTKFLGRNFYISAKETFYQK